MNVEMLQTDGCPSAAGYLPTLRRLVSGAGVRETVQVRVIGDAAQAERERFLGSPTVRIDGRDVDPDADGREDYGLSCRLYVSRGEVGRVPPDEWVLTQLRAGRAVG